MRRFIQGGVKRATPPEKDEPKPLGPNGAAVVTAVALAADPIGSAEEAEKL